MNSNAKASPEAQRVSTAQQKSAQAMQQSLEAQKHASDLENQAQAARQDVMQKQKELAQAQAKAHQLRQEAQNAQRDAARLTQQAQQIAQQSQKQALTGQQAEAQAATKQQQQVNGKLTAVSGNEVILYSGSDRMTLKVSPQTQVTLDGQKVSLNQIPEGAQVRASFTPGLGLPQATKIEAHSPGTMPQKDQQPYQNQNEAPTP